MANSKDITKNWRRPEYWDISFCMNFSHKRQLQISGKETRLAVFPTNSKLSLLSGLTAREASLVPSLSYLRSFFACCETFTERKEFTKILWLEVFFDIKSLYSFAIFYLLIFQNRFLYWMQFRIQARSWDGEVATVA